MKLVRANSKAIKAISKESLQADLSTYLKDRLQRSNTLGSLIETFLDTACNSSLTQNIITAIETNGDVLGNDKKQNKVILDTVFNAIGEDKVLETAQYVFKGFYDKYPQYKNCKFPSQNVQDEYIMQEFNNLFMNIIKQHIQVNIVNSQTDFAKRSCLTQKNVKKGSYDLTGVSVFPNSLNQLGIALENAGKPIDVNGAQIYGRSDKPNVASIQKHTGFSNNDAQALYSLIIQHFPILRGLNSDRFDHKIGSYLEKCFSIADPQPTCIQDLSSHKYKTLVSNLSSYLLLTASECHALYDENIISSAIGGLLVETNSVKRVNHELYSTQTAKHTHNNSTKDAFATQFQQDVHNLCLVQLSDTFTRTNSRPRKIGQSATRNVQTVSITGPLTEADITTSLDDLSIDSYIAALTLPSQEKTTEEKKYPSSSSGDQALSDSSEEEKDKHEHNSTYFTLQDPLLLEIDTELHSPTPFGYNPAQSTSTTSGYQPQTTPQQSWQQREAEKQQRFNANTASSPYGVHSTSYPKPVVYPGYPMYTPPSRSTSSSQISLHEPVAETKEKEQTVPQSQPVAYSQHPAYLPPSQYGQGGVQNANITTGTTAQPVAYQTRTNYTPLLRQGSVSQPLPLQNGTPTLQPQQPLQQPNPNWGQSVLNRRQNPDQGQGQNFPPSGL